MPIYNISDTAYAGLQIAQAGMLVTSQNVTGSSLDGFTRRNANTVMDALAPNSLQLNGTSFAVDGFTRQYSSLIGAQLLTQQSKSSYSDTLVQYTSSLDSLVSDNNTGLSTSLANFFNAFGTYAADPTSLASASAITAAATDVSNRMAGMSSILTQLQTSAQSGMTDTVNQVNTLLPELASINHQIINGTSPGNTAPSADLLDRRDQILTSLQKLVGGQSLINPDGTATQLLNGLPLVEKGFANKLTISNDQKAINLIYNTKNSAGLNNVQSISTIAGGQAGALLNIINNFVPNVTQRLNATAMALVKVANQAGQTGQGNATKVPIFGFQIGNNIYSSLSTGDITSTIPNITSLADLQSLYSSLSNAIDASSTLTTGLITGTNNGQVISIVAQPNAAAATYTLAQVGATNQVTLSATINGAVVSQTSSITDATLGSSQTLNFDKLGVSVTIANPAAYAVSNATGLISNSTPFGGHNTNVGQISLSNNSLAGTYTLTQIGTTLQMSGTINGAAVTQTVTVGSGNQNLNFDRFGINIPVSNATADSGTVIATDIAHAANIVVSAANYSIPVTSGIQVATPLVAGPPATSVSAINISTTASPGTYTFTADAVGNLTISGVVNGSATTQTVLVSNGSAGPINFSQFGISITTNGPATGAVVATAIAALVPNSITVMPNADSGISLAQHINNKTIVVQGNANQLQLYGLTAANFRSVAPSDPNAYMNGATPIISSAAANAVSAMSGVIGDSVASLVTDVGNQVSTWTNNQKADTAVLGNLTTQQQSVSGVKLDEEAANLLKYQQLYSASSKVLQTGNQMFSALLAIMV